MDPELHRERILRDVDKLESLREQSTVFSFEQPVESPNSLEFVFRGQGLLRASVSEGVTLADLHRVEVHIPFDYPDQPPDIRWLTPLLHPNVSFSGLVSLEDLGLPWSSDMGLEIVCERLWDVARGAFFDLVEPANPTARPWYNGSHGAPLPFDPRPLRDQATTKSTNIVQYQWVGEKWNWRSSKEVLFIGEDTPVPILPQRAPRRAASGEDVLYIGPD
jgi:ubiquitin-protein ligase